MQKPRPFNHKLIYIDERQESVRLSFGKRRQQGSRVPRLNIPMLLSLIIILAAIAFLIAYTIK